MPRTIFKFSSLFGLGLLLAACAPTPPLPPVEMTWLSLQAARTAQEGMTDTAKINPNRVYAAKVRIGNQTYSVTTYAPLILGTTGYGEEQSVSALRFSQNQDELLLFTRNPVNGEGYRAIIPLTEANDWPAFSFPFVSGKKLQTLPVQVVSLIRRPDQDDTVRGMREYLQRTVPELPKQFMELEKPPARSTSDEY